MSLLQALVGASQQTRFDNKNTQSERKCAAQNSYKSGFRWSNICLLKRVKGHDQANGLAKCSANTKENTGATERGCANSLALSEYNHYPGYDDRGGNTLQ